MEKRNMAKMLLVGFSLVLCGGAAFFTDSSGGEQAAVQAVKKAAAVVPARALAQVYITGEVQHPGIYQVKKGCRAHEVITKAGGLTEKADRDRVNLVRICRDGTHIRVPARKVKKVKASSRTYQNYHENREQGVQKKSRRRRNSSKRSVTNGISGTDRSAAAGYQESR